MVVDDAGLAQRHQNASPSATLSALVSTDYAGLAQRALDPQLCEALRRGPRAVAELFSVITSQAAAMPILNDEASAALAHEVSSARLEESRVALPASPKEGCACPATARVGSLLSRVVLPHLVQAAHVDNLLPGIFDERPRRRQCERTSGPALCDMRRAYALRYRLTEAADSGRVFVCHVDDCDVTLAICLGGIGPDDAPAWLGADLNYVVPSAAAGQARPGTPDLNDPCIEVRQHVHRPCVGVLHGGEAYHFVGPLLAGERVTLVVQAMRETGAEWKREFLRR